MSFVVTLQPSGHTFEIEPDAPILTAGLKNGVGLPYGCRAGVCTACRGKVIEGEVDHGLSHLAQEERDQGYTLLCQAKGLSNLTIEIEEVPTLTVATDFKARIKSIEMLAPDVARVTLRVPPALDLRYREGQFIDLVLGDGVTRSYSIACPPQEGGVIDIEFHIRHMPGGLFTDRLFNGEVQARAIVDCYGPMGAFYLRDSEKPVIMLASGTGYAPIRAILKDELAKGGTRPFTLYWGARIKADLYLHEEAEEMAKQYPNFSYVPVLSESRDEDAWTGRTGFVHRAVMDDHLDLSDFQVYACGAPAMIEAARADFIAHANLPTNEFFADSFVTAAEKAAEV